MVSEDRGGSDVSKITFDRLETMHGTFMRASMMS